MVNAEIKNIREALQALEFRGTGRVISDVWNIITELLQESTGLKVKDREGNVADIVSIVKTLENTYKQQLETLLREEDDGVVYQKTLEEEIATCTKIEELKQM